MQDDDQSANAATDEIEDALLCSLDSFIDSWIMDSSASFHTTPSLELLSIFLSFILSFITLFLTYNECHWTNALVRK